MQININQQNVNLNGEDKALVEGTVNFGLSRFSQRVHHIDISVSETSDGFGSLQQRWDFTLELTTGEALSVQSLSSCVKEGVESAVLRLKRMIERKRKNPLQENFDVGASK